MKVESGFIWQGDKKLDYYEQEFEQNFLTYSREEFEWALGNGVRWR